MERLRFFISQTEGLWGGAESAFSIPRGVCETRRASHLSGFLSVASGSQEVLASQEVQLFFLSSCLHFLSILLFFTQEMSQNTDSNYSIKISQPEALQKRDYDLKHLKYKITEVCEAF